ncbi:hypothetical protein CPS_4089 [Colwellia psychrerythraea 34H]|uniref:Uncharacterized protein n=1 Tax=Colwellia psychrerythraea (strain 34H / ATCC BAA-681) TaxID=167879 RepID=Q47WS8_COLP3|nr:hypothetical protein CPS_4089 [Colwellia psychrerythraea 34H]
MIHHVFYPSNKFSTSIIFRIALKILKKANTLILLID